MKKHVFQISNVFMKDMRIMLSYATFDQYQDIKVDYHEYMNYIVHYNRDHDLHVTNCVVSDCLTRMMA